MQKGSDFFHLVQLAKRRYADALRPVEQAHGLTRNEIDVLLFLANNPGYDTARDIVELRALTKSHVCKSVDSLVRRGFLAGRQDGRDRRCVRLSILPAAGGAVGEARQAQQHFFQMLYRGIPPQECRAMERMLERLADNLKEGGE